MTLRPSLRAQRSNPVRRCHEAQPLDRHVAALLAMTVGFFPSINKKSADSPHASSAGNDQTDSDDTCRARLSLRAQRSNPVRRDPETQPLDRHVAALLAMTAGGFGSPIHDKSADSPHASSAGNDQTDSDDTCRARLSLRAQRSNPVRRDPETQPLDRHVAALLAMTAGGFGSPIHDKSADSPHASSAGSNQINSYQPRNLNTISIGFQ